MDGESGGAGGLSERWMSLAAGAIVTADAVRRGGRGGIVEALVGGGLLYHGATGRLPVPEGIPGVTGGGEPSRYVHVQRAYTIERDRQELYGFWRALENLPSFMSHLESVAELDERRSHWVARAPLGASVEWDAEIVEDLPGERIRWHSLDGADVRNAGRVEFRDAPAGRGTEVRVSLEYAPPAGRVGDVVARIFGEQPDQQVRDDLRRFKQLMEAGEVPTTRGQPAGRRGATLIGTVIP